MSRRPEISPLSVIADIHEERATGILMLLQKLHNLGADPGAMETLLYYANNLRHLPGTFAIRDGIYYYE